MKSSNLKKTFIAIIVFSNLLLAQANNKIFYGEKLTIHSEIIGQDKEYWVHLPIDYETSTEQYPVMFITDGDEHFFLASGAAEFMSSQYIIPKMIIVAVFHKDRNHDLTPTHSSTGLFDTESNSAKVSGGGVKLLQFIENELTPQIEKNYKAGKYRILAGHSLGGLFSVYAYIASPNFFKAFIAMDPALTWDNNFCERTLKKLSNDAPNFQNKFYMSSAHNAALDEEDNSPFRLSQNSFFELLESKDVENIKHDFFEDENHLTVPYRSLYAGLSFIFSDYYIFNDEDFVEEPSFFKEHFEEVSSLYNMNLLPPEGLVEMLGNYFLLDRNDFKKASEFFILNTTNYPTSSIAFENLAKAYDAMGEKSKALSNYKTALKLNPESKELQRIVNVLEEIK